MSNPVQTENDPELDLFTEIQTNEAQSKAAPVSQRLSFLQKCIHPPSAVPNFHGLPTNDVRSQVLLEFREMNIIQSPSVFDYNSDQVTIIPSNQLNTYNYATLYMNGLATNSISFINNYSSGNLMTQDFANVDKRASYDPLDFSSDAMLYRPVYKSTTTYLNATAFNDTGMVTSCQFNPNVLFAGGLAEMASTNSELFFAYLRCSYKGDDQKYCFSKHAKRIRVIKRDQNDEFVGISKTNFDDEFKVAVSAWEKFPRYIRDEICTMFGFKHGTHLDIDPSTSVQLVAFGLSPVPADTLDPVPTSSQILQNSVRSYGGKARDGTFTVQRLNTLTPRWLTAGNTFDSGGGARGLYQCYMAQRLTGGWVVLPMYDNTAPGTTGQNLPVLLDTLWTSDMTWAWTFYSGLSLNSANGNNVNSQLIIRKTYCGFEVAPSFRSPWAPTMSLGPEPDLEAMQCLLDAFYELKDTLPARYNFWGTLASIAGQGLKTFGSGLLKELMSGSNSKKRDKPSKEPNRSQPSKAKASEREVSDLRRQIKDLNIKLAASVAKRVAIGKPRPEKVVAIEVEKKKKPQKRRRRNKTKQVYLDTAV